MIRSPSDERKAVCRAAFCQVSTLMISPLNIPLIRLRNPHSKIYEQPHSLISDTVFRIIQVNTRGIDHESFSAQRIIREQLTQMQMVHLLIMCQQCFPCRALR
jgi:K+-transporting ATPase A subunit